MQTQVSTSKTATTTKTEFIVCMTDGSKPVQGSQAPSPEAVCALLEKGGIVYFQQTPFDISLEDREFLLAQKQKEADYHKNIAYRPKENTVTGFAAKSQVDAQRLHSIMSDYHFQTTRFLETFLAPYTRNWEPDFATFRPIEEKGRKMSLRKRNDLIHVDSFATRPIYGDRILRTFTNINPTQNRVWRTSDTFESLLETYKNVMPAPARFKTKEENQTLITKLYSMLGLKAVGTSGYDKWMLDFHNFLKENGFFQTNSRKDTWEFPPNSSWMVFTDMVSHSVLSGQYALEQTYIISQDDLVLPSKAPINLLRKTYNL